MLNSKKLKFLTSEDAAYEIAKRSRGTPRIAIRLLKRIIDFSIVNEDDKIDLKSAQESLKRMKIDSEGLDEMDRQILTSIIDNYDGGPVGIDTLGVAISEDARTLEEVYEPYLIKKGFIQRTPRGRIALEKTYKYLNKTISKNQQQKLL